MKKTFRVLIPPIAKNSLREIVDYVKLHSPLAASRIRKELIAVAKSLAENPERYSREEILSKKPGNYRSVTKWHFKVVYKVMPDEVVILRFVHTSRNPEVIGKIE